MIKLNFESQNGVKFSLILDKNFTIFELRTKFQEILKTFPDSYYLVVIDENNEERALKVINKLYYYNLKDNTIIKIPHDIELKEGVDLNQWNLKIKTLDGEASFIFEIVVDSKLDGSGLKDKIEVITSIRPMPYEKIISHGQNSGGYGGRIIYSNGDVDSDIDIKDDTILQNTLIANGSTLYWTIGLFKGLNVEQASKKLNDMREKGAIIDKEIEKKLINIIEVSSNLSLTSGATGLGSSKGK